MYGGISNDANELQVSTNKRLGPLSPFPSERAYVFIDKARPGTSHITWAGALSPPSQPPSSKLGSYHLRSETRGESPVLGGMRTVSAETQVASVCHSERTDLLSTPSASAVLLHATQIATQSSYVRRQWESTYGLGETGPWKQSSRWPSSQSQLTQQGPSMQQPSAFLAGLACLHRCLPPTRRWAESW